MTKAEFLGALAAIYRVGNLSDSDMREDWTKPCMVGEGLCRQLDKALHVMVDTGVLSVEEYEEFISAV